MILWRTSPSRRGAERQHLSAGQHEGRVEYVNSSFTAITLYGAEEIQGRLLAELPAMENLSHLLFDARSSLARHNS